MTSPARVDSLPVIDTRLTDSITQRGSAFHVFGMTVAKPSHPRMRALREHGVEPQHFASRIWGASYLLVDYLARQPLVNEGDMLEIGCGWGLVSQYLASRCHHARMTATDLDNDVFPYLDVLSDINHTEVRTVCASFHELCQRSLSRYRLLVGADICYSQAHARQLQALVEHAFAEGIEEIILADIGRPPFLTLHEHLSEQADMQWFAHAITRPVRQQGYILHLRQTGK